MHVWKRYHQLNELISNSNYSVIIIWNRWYLAKPFFVLLECVPPVITHNSLLLWSKSSSIWNLIEKIKRSTIIYLFTPASTPNSEFTKPFVSLAYIVTFLEILNLDDTTLKARSKVYSCRYIGGKFIVSHASLDQKWLKEAIKAIDRSLLVYKIH